jgi:phosphoribulokinase
VRETIHVKLTRDEDGRPIDAVHVHGYARRETTRPIEEAIWDELGVDQPLPECLGMIEEGRRSESLALIQLILLFHVLQKQTLEKTEVPNL